MVATHGTAYKSKIRGSSMRKVLGIDVGTEVVSSDGMSGGNIVVTIEVS